MKKKVIFSVLCALLLLLLLAGCGKAATMKNYRAYAESVVGAYIADEDIREDMLKTISTWKKLEDFENFQSLMALLSGGSLKTYDNWVAADCPTPFPTIEATKDSSSKTTATPKPTDNGKSAASKATATPAPTAAAQPVGGSAPQGGGSAPQGGGTPPQGGSGEPSGNPPPN